MKKTTPTQNPQRGLTVHPAVAAATLAAAALMAGVLVGQRTAPAPKAQVAAVSEVPPAGTIADLVRPPGLSQTTREPAGGGTRAEKVAKTGVEADLAYFRCNAAGGTVKRHSGDKCSVPLPALNAVSNDTESRRAQMELFVMRCTAAGGEFQVDPMRCSVELPALAAEN